jgi:hypothetical protein
VASNPYGEFADLGRSESPLRQDQCARPSIERQRSHGCKNRLISLPLLELESLRLEVMRLHRYRTRHYLRHLTSRYLSDRHLTRVSKRHLTNTPLGTPVGATSIAIATTLANVD